MNGTAKSIFRIGELYTHEEVFTRLGVGNAGGIRSKVDKEIVSSSDGKQVEEKNSKHHLLKRLAGGYWV